MANILVTGTRGFLGSHLATHLKNIGHTVQSIRGKADWRIGLEKAKQTVPQIIIHGGFSTDFAIANGHAESENLRHSRELGQFAKTVGSEHLIFISAAAVMGVSANPRVRSELDIGNCDADFSTWMKTRYVGEKLQAEAELKALLLPKLSILYPTTTYGPGMHPKALATLQNLKGLLPFALCPAGGTSFLGLQDFLRALEIVMQQRLVGAFLISSGNCTYKKLLQEAAKTLAKRKKIVVLSPAFKALAARFSADAVLNSSFGYKYYSAQKLIEASSWKPRQNLADCLSSALLSSAEVRLVRSFGCP